MVQVIVIVIVIVIPGGFGNVLSNEFDIFQGVLKGQTRGGTRQPHDIQAAAQTANVLLSLVLDVIVVGGGGVDGWLGRRSTE